jgi:hypothetical protein
VIVLSDLLPSFFSSQYLENNGNVSDPVQEGADHYGYQVMMSGNNHSYLLVVLLFLFGSFFVMAPVF